MGLFVYKLNVMIRKKAMFHSLAHQTCPRCHEGKMFDFSPYRRQFMHMNKSCSHCDLDFIREPSFYFGAMYFSYAIQVAVFICVYFALRYTIDPGTWTYVIWMLLVSVLIMPVNYRISRVMWLSLFISYQGASKNPSNQV
jgi:uncharacterized protein (DUF983 family)